MYYVIKKCKSMQSMQTYAKLFINFSLLCLFASGLLFQTFAFHAFQLDLNLIQPLHDISRNVQPKYSFSYIPDGSNACQALTEVPFLSSQFQIKHIFNSEVDSVLVLLIP